jgi:flagellar motor switch protein FliM
MADTQFKLQRVYNDVALLTIDNGEDYRKPTTLGRAALESLDRALTEIELNVVDSVVKLLLEHLTETWRTIADLRFHVHGRETRPQMLQVASWNEVVVLLAFDIKVAETRGLFHVCVPASIVEASGSTLVQSWQHARRDPTTTEQQWLVENLGRVRMPVTTDIQARLRTRELLNLEAGQVLNLGVPLEAPVNIRVGDVVKFEGRLAASGDRAAVVVKRSLTSAADQDEVPRS